MIIEDDTLFFNTVLQYHHLMWALALITLNVIFNVVDKNIFRLINTCVFAKEAWDILAVAHEGTSKVKMSRLQLLTSKFEGLKMLESESIAEFNVRLLDISNESFALGMKIFEEKLVRKVLRSLPKKYDMKVTVVKEAQDIATIKVDELFSSLRTFEMSLDEKSNKKVKGMALQSSMNDHNESKLDIIEDLLWILSHYSHNNLAKY